MLRAQPMIDLTMTTKEVESHLSNEISIDAFYQKNKVEPNFDENFYQTRYPETKDFYQPYCKNENIDNCISELFSIIQKHH